MQTGNGLDNGPTRRVEMPEFDKVIGQEPVLVARPRSECREQRPLIDQAVLQGEQAEEKVALSINGGHGTVLPDTWRGPRVPGLRRRRPRREP